MKKTKLAAKLLFSCVIAMIAALLVFRVVTAIGYSIASELEDSNFYNREMQKVVYKMQEYADSDAITTKNLSSYEAYANELNWYILGFYNSDGVLLYDSTDGLLPHDSKELSDEMGDDDLYMIHLADADVQMYLYIDILLGRLYSLADITAGVFAFVAFATVLLLMIRKKLNYILQLEHEMHVLEDEGLEHEITVRGRDELGSLAQSIDDMRKSVITKQNHESQAVQANKDLITAVSHDLRTPLTSLLGYIELIRNGSYKDEKQLEYFISMCHDKVIHIKDMTDQLFNYSCVNSDSDFNPQEIDAYEFVQQVLSDMIFELENDGFKVNYVPTLFVGTISAQPNELVRVFENMISNMKKYADKAVPVNFVCSLDDSYITIICENAVSGGTQGGSGTHLGLKTCKRILERHSGSFSTVLDTNVFTSTIIIPYFKIT